MTHDEVIAAFAFEDDKDEPGWLICRPVRSGWFFDLFGLVRARAEDDRHARIRFMPEPRHLNIIGTVHGGFSLAVVDQVLFLAPAALGVSGAVGGNTIDTSAQFIAPLLTGKPMDAVVEILRETGRMIFMRGLIEQDGIVSVAFSGTIKKAPTPR